MKILFKFASRQRPARFFDALKNIIDNVEDTLNYLIICTLDSDDDTMNTPEIKEKIKTFPNTIAYYGSSESKIHAINRDMEKEAAKEWEWRILIVMSDDMKFLHYGFDRLIREGFEINCPDGDGFLHYPDQDAGIALSTMSIIGRKYYERFNYIYHPSYKSLWCDNEAFEVARMLGKYHYMGIRLFDHLNPAYGHLPRDPMFEIQQDHWAVDEGNFKKRREINFDLVKKI